MKTIVALDNLRRYLIGDPGGAVSCDPSTLAGPITPRVPALGLGSLTGCPPPDQALTDKTTGYKNWRAAGAFVEEAVLAHSNHNGYTGGAPFNAAHRAQLKHAAYYVLAWLARWLRGDTTQDARLVSQTPLWNSSDRHACQRHQRPGLHLLGVPAVQGMPRVARMPLRLWVTSRQALQRVEVLV